MKHLKWVMVCSIILIACNSKTMENHLIIKDSPYDVETTYSRLKTLLNNNPNLKVLLELDHSKNAASVDLELNPTKIIMFGNPKLGTPLMQASPTVAIDLPQKIIVYTVDSKTKIAYNNPFYLKERHDIIGKDAVLEKISGALNTITTKVIALED